MNYLIKINSYNEYHQYLKIFREMKFKSWHETEENPYCIYLNILEFNFTTGDDELYDMWRSSRDRAIEKIIFSIVEFNSILEKHRGLLNMNKLNLI